MKYILYLDYNNIFIWMFLYTIINLIKVFYCSEKCKYKDQKWHIDMCALAYDSDSDNEENEEENFEINQM